MSTTISQFLLVQMPPKKHLIAELQIPRARIFALVPRMPRHCVILLCLHLSICMGSWLHWKAAALSSSNHEPRNLQCFQRSAIESITRGPAREVCLESGFSRAMGRISKPQRLRAQKQHQHVAIFFADSQPYYSLHRAFFASKAGNTSAFNMFCGPMFSHSGHMSRSSNDTKVKPNNT